jgi:hypothetical protein
MYGCIGGVENADFYIQIASVEDEHHWQTLPAETLAAQLDPDNQLREFELCNGSFWSFIYDSSTSDHVCKADFSPVASALSG